jgi:hypothetical protein
LIFVQTCELESPLQGAVEVDESYLGAHSNVRGINKTVVLAAKRSPLVYWNAKKLFGNSCLNQALQHV